MHIAWILKLYISGNTVEVTKFPFSNYKQPEISTKLLIYMQAQLFVNVYTYSS